MIKKVITSVLFCFYCTLSFAQESIYGNEGQSSESYGWLWMLLICALVIGVAMFFVGVYVNKRIQKIKQTAANQQIHQPMDSDQLQHQKHQKQQKQNNDELVVQNPLITEAAILYPPVETPEEFHPDTPVANNEESGLPTLNNGTKYKVLIIEDQEDIRVYMQILFRKDYTLLMAENGEEGLKLARKEFPDLIITDVMMPMMDGFECCKRIKENLKTCHIPVIVLTALVGDENVVKGIELGADDYIEKPFNPEILKTKVKQLIKSRQELKQLYSRLLTPTPIEQEETDKSEEKSEDPFISHIVQIVENNLQNPEFSVKRLSEMLNMSQPTLYRRVKLLTNFTIIEFVRGIRLKRSAELLKSRQYNVQEVAEMVGYNDIPTFRKHFVDFYGTTPSTYGRNEI